MSARRCPYCSLNYPMHFKYRVCPGCGDDTYPASNLQPTPGWEEAAADVKETLRKAEEAPPDFPTFEIPITERDGERFISSLEVCQAGWQTPLVPDTLVHVNGEVYEVGGYITSMREYWLIPIAEEDTVGV